MSSISRWVVFFNLAASLCSSYYCKGYFTKECGIGTQSNWLFKESHFQSLEAGWDPINFTICTIEIMGVHTYLHCSFCLVENNLCQPSDDSASVQSAKSHLDYFREGNVLSVVVLFV